MKKYDWKEYAMQKKQKNNEAIYESRFDAINYGEGWIKVDQFGNLKRVNPKDVTVIYNKEPK